MVDYKELLNRLLDDRCDLYGARNTISYLLDEGYTRDDLIELDFDEEDVDYVIKALEEDPDVEFDCE